MVALRGVSFLLLSILMTEEIKIDDIDLSYIETKDLEQHNVLISLCLSNILRLIATRYKTVGDKVFIWQAVRWMKFFLQHTKDTVIIWTVGKKAIKQEWDGNEDVYDDVSFDINNIKEADYPVVKMFLDYIQ